MQMCAVGEEVNAGHCLLPHIYSNCRDSSFVFFISVTSCWRRWEAAVLPSPEIGGLYTQRLCGPKTGQDKRNGAGVHCGLGENRRDWLLDIPV